MLYLCCLCVLSHWTVLPSAAASGLLYTGCAACVCCSLLQATRDVPEGGLVLGLPVQLGLSVATFQGGG